MNRRLLLVVTAFIAAITSTFAIITEQFEIMFGEGGFIDIVIGNAYVLGSLIYFAMLFSFQRVFALLVSPVFRGNKETSDRVGFMFSFMGTSGIYYILLNNGGIEYVLTILGGYAALIMVLLIVAGTMRFLDSMTSENGRWDNPNWRLAIGSGALIGSFLVSAFILKAEFDRNGTVMILINDIFSLLAAFGIFMIISGIKIGAAGGVIYGGYKGYKKIGSRRKEVRENPDYVMIVQRIDGLNERFTEIRRFMNNLNAIIRNARRGLRTQEFRTNISSLLEEFREVKRSIHDVVMANYDGTSKLISFFDRGQGFRERLTNFVSREDAKHKEQYAQLVQRHDAISTEIDRIIDLGQQIIQLLGAGGTTEEINANVSITERVTRLYAQLQNDINQLERLKSEFSNLSFTEVNQVIIASEIANALGGLVDNLARSQMDPLMRNAYWGILYNYIQQHMNVDDTDHNLAIAQNFVEHHTWAIEQLNSIKRIEGEPEDIQARVKLITQMLSRFVNEIDYARLRRTRVENVFIRCFNEVFNLGSGAVRELNRVLTYIRTGRL